MQKKIPITPLPETGQRGAIAAGLLSRYRGFGKDAHRLLYMTLFGSVGGAFIWFILVLYLKELGYSPVFFGSVVFLQGMSQALVAIPAGRLSDFYGRKKPIIAGSILSLIGTSILIFPLDPFLIFSSALLNGLGVGISVSALSSLLAQRTTTSRRKYLFSLQSISMMIGSALAMLLSGFFPDLFRSWGDPISGYRLVMFIGAFFMFLRAVISFFIKEPEDREVPERGMPKSMQMILKFSIPNIFIGIGAGLVIPFMQLQFNYRFGTTPTGIGMIFALNQILMIFVIVILPKIAERKGTIRTVSSLWAAATILMFLLPESARLSGSILIFTALYLIRAILMNSTGAIASAFRMNIIPDEDKGVADAVAMVSWLMFNSFGAFIGGYLIERSFDLPFYIATLFYGASVISYYAFFHKIDDMPKKAVNKSE